GVSDSRVACFGVEPDEQFARQCDADDHLFLACSHQSGAELGKTFVVSCCDGGDEEQDGAYCGATTSDVALALVFATVVSERRETDKLGNGFVGVGADLGQLGVQPGDGAAGDPL